MPNSPICNTLMMLTALCSMALSSAAWSQTDWRHMRGVHATSNYGTNENGIRRSVLAPAPSMSASSAVVHVSRSSGANGTWDLAAVSLAGVSVGGAPLSSAGFWISRNVTTGELGLAFNPSMDTSLANIPGFAGDINIPRTPEGVAFLDQVPRASGTARNLLLASIEHGRNLIATATFHSSGNSTFDQPAVLASMEALKSSIQQADNAKAQYFSLLRAMNVEWVAITVPIFNDSIGDPTVKVRVRPEGGGDTQVYTFKDEDLRDFLVSAREAGFKLALGFEFYPVISAVTPASPGCGTPAYKPNRWLLGQPVIGANEPDAQCISSRDWWWNPGHPAHAVNVATFFGSMTQVLVHYARMARETGVDMLLLGTEQDNLFRTRSASAPYTNHFRTELTALMQAVRAEYKGPIGVEQLWTTIAQPHHFAGGTGTAEAFVGAVEDLGLDVVALSAYFPLASSPLREVLSTAQFELAWDQVFRTYLQPLKAKYPGKPLILTEWGYTNDLNGPVAQASRLGEPDPSGTTPGGLQQRNVIEAFFNLNERLGHPVQGAFLYGVNFPNPADCNHVTFGVYCKPGEQALTSAYQRLLQADADRIFAWAERLFPQFFPSTAPSQTAGGFYFRYYPATGTYVGVKEGRLYLHNGRDWNLVDLGYMRAYLDMAAGGGF